MSKRLLLILISILLLASITIPQVCQAKQNESVYPDVDMSIGFSPPNIGWIHYKAGRIKSISGFNMGLGYSWRGYFGSGVKVDQFNGYWGWGTVIILFPYLEVGTTYAAPISGGTQVLALDIGLMYIFPYLSFSIWM